MADDELLIEVKQGTAVLTFNRPNQHNAFNDELIKKLTAQLQALENNNQVEIVILNAEGKSFCAGADLEWMQRMASFTETENKADALQLALLLRTLASLQKPTIALAKGNVMGGGLGLLACCDIVIAADSSRFCFSEAKLGLIPATICPYVVQAIGQRATRYYFLTAQFFDVLEAQRLGLVHKIVKSDELEANGWEMVAILQQNGPNALRAIKQLITRICPLDNALLEESAELIAKVRASSEAREGLAAFFEKRHPNWR